MANKKIVVRKIEDGDLAKLSDLMAITTDEMTVGGLQEFREITMKVMDHFSYTMVEMLAQNGNMDNDGVGTSHKSLCNRHNINHRKAIEFIRSIGYIDDENRLTKKGLLETNNLKEFDRVSSSFRPVLADNDGMGLYWDESNKHFKELWDRVVENTPGIFNDQLKIAKNPLGLIAKLLKEANIGIKD
jgi:hypothetical protein